VSSAAVTIDVDSLRFYRAIHGRSGTPLPLAEDPIYTVALERFYALIEAVRAPATLFVVGADAPAHPQAFARARALGCELASHSYAHDYRLSRQAPAAIAEDLRQADVAIAALAGAPVRGFRAPGYNVTPALLEAVRALGYRYDSSLLPAPAYFAARAAAIAVYGRLGRPSASLAGDVRQFLGPLDGPYPMHPEHPWDPTDGGSLLELPMAVDPLTRTPLIGTTITTLPERVVRAGVRAALAKSSCFVLELHAIDLLDASDHPALAELAADQRDVRVPVKTKLARLGAVLAQLGEARRFRTLAELAQA
jgi:hypothetical protein